MVREVHHLSDGISHKLPTEGGPVGEARLSIDGFIVDSWGGYASRLIEHYAVSKGVFLTFDKVLDMLNITREQVLDNPEPPFRDGQQGEQYSEYISGLKRIFWQEAQEYFAPYRRQIEDIINALERGMEPVDKTVADAEIAKAKEQISKLQVKLEQIQAQCDELGKRCESLFLKSAWDGLEPHEKAEKEQLQGKIDVLCENIERIKNSIALLRLKISSLQSGACIGLDQLLENLYRVDLSNNPLSGQWGKALDPFLEAFWAEHDIDVEYSKVTDVYVGKGIFKEFLHTINIYRPTKNYMDSKLKDKLKEINPAFFSSVKLDNNPLLTGKGEK